MTTLTAVAPADLYEVVDGQKVEKTPLGAYETLLSSQHTPNAPTPLPSCAACPDRAAVGHWRVLPQGWRQKAF
jgi:hypothetical protein